jgi:hypothetical protein
MKGGERITAEAESRRKKYNEKTYKTTGLIFSSSNMYACRLTEFFQGEEWVKYDNR